MIETVQEMTSFFLSLLLLTVTSPTITRAGPISSANAHHGSADVVVVDCGWVQGYGMGGCYNYANGYPGYQGGTALMMPQYMSYPVTTAYSYICVICVVCVC